jgi:alpha-L-arabinofuranosidase
MGRAKLEILRHDDPMAENTLENPKNVAPKQSEQSYAGGTLKYEAKPYSLGIIRVPLK